MNGSTPEFMKDGRLDLSVVDVFSNVVEVICKPARIMRLCSRGIAWVPYPARYLKLFVHISW